jgi:uncharacterized membrane protein (UPF0136 family)
MWGAIIGSVAAVVAVFLMQGPIVALALTAASSLALLVAMRFEERKMHARNPVHQPLQVIDGKTQDGVELVFPPLQQKAS